MGGAMAGPRPSHIRVTFAVLFVGFVLVIDT